MTKANHCWENKAKRAEMSVIVRVFYIYSQSLFLYFSKCKKMCLGQGVQARVGRGTQNTPFFFLPYQNRHGIYK